jgi:threonine/homoserine/homoserine lactone efflux protein
MAATIVVFDLVWFSTLAFTVDRASTVLRPRLRRTLERVAGGVMVAFGVQLAAEAR